MNIYRATQYGKIISEGTMKEISKDMGLKEYVLRSKTTKSYREKFKDDKSRLVIEKIESDKTRYLYRLYVGYEWIGTGSIKELSEMSGYTEGYLRFRACSKSVEKYNKRLIGNQDEFKNVTVEKIENTN